MYIPSEIKVEKAKASAESYYEQIQAKRIRISPIASQIDADTSFR
jgi:hypothetical protein